MPFQELLLHFAYNGSALDSSDFILLKKHSPSGSLLAVRVANMLIASKESSESR